MWAYLCLLGQRNGRQNYIYSLYKIHFTASFAKAMHRPRETLYIIGVVRSLTVQYTCVYIFGVWVKTSVCGNYITIS